MVRISLPKADCECDLERLYNALSESYLNAAKKYINDSSLGGSFFLEVSFTVERGEKEIKIKRLANLKQGAKTIKYKMVTDVFSISDFSLKK